MSQSPVLHNQSGNRSLGTRVKEISCPRQSDNHIEVGLFLVQNQGLGKVVADSFKGEHADLLVFAIPDFSFSMAPTLQLT